MARSPEPVLDASALICLIRREPGWENVARYGMSCNISAVNTSEAVHRLRKHGMPLETIDLCIRQSVGQVMPFDREQAFIAASIHADTRDRGLSLADCACLALGMLSRAPVITADSKWRELSLDVEIVQIR